MMGFASGSVTFRRYYLAGQHPDTLGSEWLNALQNRAFGRQAELRDDGLEVGWIVPNHLFDTDFSDAQRITVGRWIFLAMRMDRTRAPSAIVKSYERMEQDALRKAAGSDPLNREDQRLARENARDKAEREARSGKYRRASAYPALIDLEKGVAYFGNLGSTAGECFTKLFSETLGVTLVPATAEEIAYRAAAARGLTRSFEDASPLLLVDPPTGEDASSALKFPGADRGFLGSEFLTWLWYRCDKGEGLHELPRRGSVTVAMQRTLHLECGFNLNGSVTIRSDAPTATPEARTALRVGKAPTKMGLLIGGAGEEWSLVLDGPRANVSSLVIPRDQEEIAEPAELLEYRLNQAGRVAELLDLLFHEFLNVRLSADWSNIVAAMRRWAGAAPSGHAAQRATA